MPTFIHPTKKLGKRAPRLSPRLLKLAKYVLPVAPPPPPAVDYSGKVASYPMYLNDVYGDCVIAAAGHAIQEWTAYAGSEVTITDADILAGYEAVGGYVPGDASTDNGCDMLSALQYWKATGFGGHKIAGFVSVDPTNQAEVEQAIYLLGNVYMGIALPLSAQDQTAWKFTGITGDGSPGSWGGHCVIANSYASGPYTGVTVITWGAPLWASWKFVRRYVDECYAIITTDWLNSLGQSPEGFDLDQLRADLAQL